MTASKSQRGVHSDGELRVDNGCGLSMTVSPFGARLVELLVPDREGQSDNVTLGFDDTETYRRNVNLYFGATVGRVAGRIAGGEFWREGQRFQLACNEGNNHLHGGCDRSLDRVEWTSQPITTERGPGVLFEYVSPHLEEGYPGQLTVRSEYSLSAQNELWTVLTAVSDASTPVNLTNHTYWSLNGGAPGSILDHELMIAAGDVVSTSDDLIPTGGLDPVAGTPLDFRSPHTIGERLPGNSSQPWPGFDNAYVLDAHDMSDVVASLWDPISGRSMDIMTSEPSLQVYTANRLAHMSGRGGRFYGAGSAICLEPQRRPDAFCKPDLGSIMLPTGAEYRHVSCYRFSVR